MTTSKMPESSSLYTEYSYRNYIDAHFLRLAYADEFMTVIGGAWMTAETVANTPGERLGGISYANGQEERLVRVGTALCQIVQNEQSLVVRAAASNRPAAEAAIAEIKQALLELEPVEREVPARFWWWGPGGPAELARTVPYEPWDELQHNYAGQTHARLAELSAWRGPPAGGRLILWHGEPGTGKTSAIRTLAGEWRSWTEFQFVTDPEEFLSNPSYLLGTVTRAARRTGRRTSEPWKVIVLEDSGEFLMPDAKRATGQSLSRLLNVCDGVLGIAMRVLVLITTNEPVSELHCAVTRPGRCISEISFESFGDDDIIRWCAREDTEPLGKRSASLAELFAHRDGRAAKRGRIPVGFAAA